MLHIVCEYVVIHENMCPLSDGKCRIGAIHRQTHRCMFKCKTAAPMCDSGQFGQVYTDI